MFNCIYCSAVLAHCGFQQFNCHLCYSKGNCLIVLSEEDGFSRVIDVATEFCREAVKSTNQSSNIDVSYIDQQLSGQ